MPWITRLSSVPVAAWIDRTGRAEAHEAERAHARRLAVQITVEPEQDADQGRHAEPNRDVEDVHRGTNLAPQMAICSAWVPVRL